MSNELGTFVCQRCELSKQRTGRNQKVCADCKVSHHKEYCKEFHTKNYVKRGYNQKGKMNNSYKTGIWVYKSFLKDHCEFCDKYKKHRCVHHIDENRLNNEEDNLVTLCRSCHILVHNRLRDSEGRFI